MYYTRIKIYSTTYDAEKSFPFLLLWTRLPNCFDSNLAKMKIEFIKLRTLIYSQKRSREACLGLKSPHTSMLKYLKREEHFMALQVVQVSRSWEELKRICYVEKHLLENCNIRMTWKFINENKSTGTKNKEGNFMNE